MKFNNCSRFRHEKQAFFHRRDARHVAAAQARQALLGRPDRVGGDVDELAGVVGDEPHGAAVRLDDDEARAKVVGGPFEAEARAEIDGRHDLAAGKDHAVDKRRRVRHAGHAVQHLHVLHIAAAKAVEGSRDGEHDEGVGHRCGHLASLRIRPQSAAPPSTRAVR